MMRTSRQSSLFFSLVSFFFLYLLGMKVHAVKNISSLKTSSFSIFQELPLKKILSLGHASLIDDLVYLEFLNVFQQKKTQTLSSESWHSYFISVIKIHPKIETIYLLVCYKMNFEWKKPEGCESVLKVGAMLLKDSWKIPFTLGYLYVFYWHNFPEASFYYDKASQVQGAPAFFKSFAKKLRENKIELEERIKNLQLFNEILKP